MPTNESLSIDFAPIEGVFYRVVVSGTTGIGSEGNIHGKQIRDAIQDLIDREKPEGIVVDCRKLKYRFGNYMCGAVISTDCTKRTCVLAQGETLRCLRSLWDHSRMNRLIPIFDDEIEAIKYITRDME